MLTLYTEEELDNLTTEFRININTRADLLLHLWELPREVVISILVAFKGSFDQADEYIDFMTGEEVEQPHECWAAWCEKEGIEHEIDNIPF